MACLRIMQDSIIKSRYDVVSRLFTINEGHQ